MTGRHPYVDRDHGRNHITPHPDVNPHWLHRRKRARRIRPGYAGVLIAGLSVGGAVAWILSRVLAGLR